MLVERSCEAGSHRLGVAAASTLARSHHRRRPGSDSDAVHHCVDSFVAFVAALAPLSLTSREELWGVLREGIAQAAGDQGAGSTGSSLIPTHSGGSGPSTAAGRRMELRRLSAELVVSATDRARAAIKAAEESAAAAAAVANWQQQQSGSSAHRARSWGADEYLWKASGDSDGGGVVHDWNNLRRQDTHSETAALRSKSSPEPLASFPTMTVNQLQPRSDQNLNNGYSAPLPPAPPTQPTQPQQPQPSQSQRQPQPDEQVAANTPVPPKAPGKAWLEIEEAPVGKAARRSSREESQNDTKSLDEVRKQIQAAQAAAAAETQLAAPNAQSQMVQEGALSAKREQVAKIRREKQLLLKKKEAGRQERRAQASQRSKNFRCPHPSNAAFN